MNTDSFLNSINRISEALAEQEKYDAVNIQAFGRKDADSWSFYFYQVEGEFKDAVANGICKRYNECGALIQEGIFLDGKPVVIYDYDSYRSKVRCYVSNGELLEKEYPVGMAALRKIEQLQTFEL